MLAVHFMGVDDMFALPVHAQRFCCPENGLYNLRFRDMSDVRTDDTLIVHHSRLHEHQPMG